MVEPDCKGAKEKSADGVETRFVLTSLILIKRIILKIIFYKKNFISLRIIKFKTQRTDLNLNPQLRNRKDSK